MAASGTHKSETCRAAVTPLPLWPLNPAGMSFSLSFHQALLGLTGAHWLDEPFNLSCKNSTRQYAVDDPLLSCK